MVDHTKEEFKKYAYQYGKGTDRTNTRTERDTLSADTLWTEKDTKALGDFDPNLGIRIKVENKDLDKVQGMVTGHNETAPLSEEEEDPDDDLTVLEIKPKYRIIKKKSLMKELQSKESDLLNQVADLQAQMLTLKTEVSQWLDDCPNDGKAVLEFRRVHQAYENLLADPERSSDLMVLKMQHPFPSGKPKRISIPSAFQTEARCLSLVSQLRLPNVAKLVEVGPENQFIVTWPYLPEALVPNNECDGISQVDRVDLVRQGWSDYARSRHSAQRVIAMMMSMIRHDVMVVDPIQNIIVDRESGEPLMIDFGRGETAGSIYTTRIKTFMKKVLQLLARCVSKASYDVAARLIRSLEDTLFECLERWQDEKTRDQKKALALVQSNTRWQEGIQCCREIWSSQEENPFRRMFKDQKDVLPSDRVLREARSPEELPQPDSEDEAPQEQPDGEDDPEGLCDADINTLTPVQRLLRAKRKKSRRAKLPKEKPNVRVKVDETMPDGTLGLGLDDADEDHRGLVIVQVHKKAEKCGWQLGDRIVDLNGKEIDEWDDFREAWGLAKQFGTGGVVFGVVREGVEAPPEEKEPRCLNCNVKGKHLQRCTNWAWLMDGENCVYFCGRDCQKTAWNDAKKKPPVSR
ncbi:unnamed protein product [Polarella glacialis]|uniref:PDZ domain-containing protein n=1 Tax=Polarella glacialis TaxID=89957 RepID=A0A813D2H0_POLGL|nr:unnamed protein product [Polarella glacialis]